MQETDKVNQFLEGVRGGLQPSSEQVTIWVVLVGGLVLIVILTTLLIALYRRRRRLQAERRRLQSILMQRGLSQPEQELVARLERYFTHDKSRLADLAHEPALFDGAARRMAAAEPETEEPLARLRYKLGLILKNAFQAPHATTELTPGMAIFITLHGRVELNAMITDVQERGFFVKSDLPGRVGDEATLELNSNAGVFRFKTEIIEVDSGFFLLAHTVHIEQVQKRRFLRKKLSLPVILELPRTQEKLETYALDISGGGARIHNPRLVFQVGEPLVVVFFFDRTERAAVAAKVIRSSPLDRTVSVAFEKIKESERDKILKLAR